MGTVDMTFDKMSDRERDHLREICLKGLRDDDVDVFSRAAYCLSCFTHDTALMEEALSLLDALPEKEEILLVDSIGKMECKEAAGPLEERFLALRDARFSKIEEKGMTILRALAGIRAARSVEFARQILFPSHDETAWNVIFKEAVVEILLNLALDGNAEAFSVIQQCQHHVIEEVRQSSTAALAEINELDWGRRGFVTFYAKLPKSD
jgi:hypothetical protein